MNKKFLLILLCLLLFFLNYSTIDSILVKNFQDYEVGLVQRVVDGDTVVIENQSIRLLGINSPERGEIGYSEAKEFLENQILGKNVELHFEGNKYDKYNRKLAYIFYKNKNINLESVRLGYSGFYFPVGKTYFYKNFQDAWEFCLEANTGLCKKSEIDCIILKDWDVSEQKIILKNMCNQPINLEGFTIKDEGRKKYTFENKILETQEEITLTNYDWGDNYVWTKSGDSIFIRDSEGGLVLFDNY